MNARTFFDTVVAMRKSQKAYFKYRLQRDLSESRRLEMLIDREIERVNDILGTDPKPKEQQNSLF